MPAIPEIPALYVGNDIRFITLIFVDAEFHIYTEISGRKWM